MTLVREAQSKMVSAVIASSCGLVPFQKTRLALASLGEDTNLIGAARVWHYRFGPEVRTRAL
jgi:glucokinase